MGRTLRRAGRRSEARAKGATPLSDWSPVPSVAVDRRRFLRGAVLGAAPVVFGAGVGVTATRALTDDQGLRTAARSAPGLGVRGIVWSVRTDEPTVALTFDDGPDPDLTPGLLDTLRYYGVPATFMLVGARVAASPDLVRRAVASGHEIGNHTYWHRSLAMLERHEVAEELERTAEVLAATVPDAPVRWFRPPRGVLTGAGAQAAAAHGYDTLMWSCSRGPATTTDPAAVAGFVVRHLDPGTIVCLHDGLGAAGFTNGPMAQDLRAKRRVEMRALPLVIERALDRGVRFVTVSELVTADTATTGRMT